MYDTAECKVSEHRKGANWSHRTSMVLAEDSTGGSKSRSCLVDLLERYYSIRS